MPANGRQVRWLVDTEWAALEVAYLPVAGAPLALVGEGTWRVLQVVWVGSMLGQGEVSGPENAEKDNNNNNNNT